MHISHYTATPPYTTFLYPKSRQYPFDEVCEKIVRALAGRNWKVPGIQVKFCDRGTGELKYRHVYTIKGENFRLLFSRDQGYINPSKYDVAAIEEMVIPQKELHVFSDESGPTLYTYIGDNWEDDKDTFVNKVKVYSKSKIYLRYSGASKMNGDLQGSYMDSRKEFLVHKNYGEVPKYFHTDQIFQEFKDWLTAHVLEKIELVDVALNVELTSEPSIPYPEHLGPFYVKINRSTYERILLGKKDKNQLEASQRHASLGGREMRLVTLNVQNDGTFPEEAYDGFTYCSFTIPEITKIGKDFILRILPKNANHIFVANYELAIQYKKNCFAANPKKSMLTDEEYDEFQRCLGRTLVPIHEYKGNYVQPVVLIGSCRELSFDEVQIVAHWKL